MTRHAQEAIKFSGRCAGSVSLIAAIGLLSACATTGDSGGGGSVSGFDEITLAPGDTGNCDSSPCMVYLMMPPGPGTYEVMSSTNGRIGEYPAGERVKLGSFWNSQAFTIQGMAVPKAYAYIPNQR